MRTATFDNTVSILVKAYLNSTLEHSNCHACAVGNIVCHNMGFKFEYLAGELCWLGQELVKAYKPDSGWANVFATPSFIGKQFTNPECYVGKAKKQIDSTGYKWQDLAKIEYAFEMADRGQSKDDYMFNGLMAVVDVLADIHGINLEAKEEAKKLFVKI